MQLLQDGLVAMLAAIGLASIMWMVVKAVLYAPLERRRQGTVALIPAQGDGEGLEGQIRIMERLRKVDQVAYVRFASVYRQFKDIDTFKEELNKLLLENE